MNRLENKGNGNVESRDEWETPKWLFDTLDKQYTFGFDCCANEDNKKCERYTNEFQRFISLKETDWVCWMNPPFSKAKEMFEHFFKSVNKGVAIYRCDNMETKLWQETIFPNASWIFIFDKRTNYEGMEGQGSVFPSALIGFNVNKPEGLNGTCLVHNR